ncbi:MAG: nitronate monooxygenase, partial [Roseomonas sp.]|nr:nitronate monooxygenase [Roseomonas sp.]
ERVARGVLEGAKGLVHGVTCGAGMPYRLADLARDYGVHYYPIVSSARAFNALWKRSYSKAREWLGGVVYEDPWLAGGHNGLSNSEDPKRPEDPFPRVLKLRQSMNEFGLNEVPIIMAGGVWWLEEWEDWIDNPDLGPVAFQFGTRPLLTQESPISQAWKQRLLELKPGDVLLQPFSPTGFYSSAIHNGFLRELEERNDRQVAFSTEPTETLTAPYGVGPRKRIVHVAPADLGRIAAFEAAGFTDAMRTPDDTLVFVTPAKGREILKDQVDCMGCLSHCRFSNWSHNEPDFSTGRKADPRSFCIQKTLQDIAHDGALEENLVFAGHNAYRFGADPFYSNGFVPTAKQLVERLMTGR